MPGRARWLVLVLAAAVTAVFGGCGPEPAASVRTDPEPLLRRLHLPPGLHTVRWIAVSSVSDTGWIPPKAEFYDVYAYIPLTPYEWTALEKAAGTAGPPTTIGIPEDVAVRLLPADATREFEATAGVRRTTRPAFDPMRLAADPHTSVQFAVRVGAALVIEMRVR